MAGATGLIGRSPAPLLPKVGHTIIGTTRTCAGEAKLKALGVALAVVDVFERNASVKAVVDAAPDKVIHQLTDLAAGIDPNAPEEGSTCNARLRCEDTWHRRLHKSLLFNRNPASGKIALAIS